MQIPGNDPLFYRGGHANECRLGVLAGRADAPDGDESTLFFTLAEGAWSTLALDFAAVSATTHDSARGDPDTWWLLGKRGEVVEYVGGAMRRERIDAAGTGPVAHKLGYLSQIRSIGGELFICGYRRQVYRRDAGAWQLVSSAILDMRETGPWRGLESIDGFAADDVYAVGDHGEIWHFDGAVWTACDSPTNQTLADVRCIDGKAWICGDAGLLLCGDVDGWEVLWDEDTPSENWWSLERFMGQTYLAGNDFLGVLTDDGIAAVDTGIGRELSTMVLRAAGGRLWSIGETDILMFDGTSWRVVSTA